MTEIEILEARLHSAYRRMAELRKSVDGSEAFKGGYREGYSKGYSDGMEYGATFDTDGPSLNNYNMEPPHGYWNPEPRQ
jgi:hypothetical protein